MSRQQVFVLDANVLIEAARRYYPLDFAMPFWDFLISEAKKGNILSIDKVYDEITTGNDLLKNWAVSSFSPYCLSTQSPDVFNSYAQIVQNVQNNAQYNQTAKDEFMDAENADTWILAYAHAKGHTIVTHEVSDSFIKKRVPIPNVCINFGIDYCDCFEMLRALNFSF